MRKGAWDKGTDLDLRIVKKGLARVTQPAVVSERDDAIGLR